MEINNPFGLIAVYLWVASVFAICVRDMVLKVKPAGKTVPFGTIRLMFKSLNLFEFGFALTVIASFFICRQNPFASDKVTLFIPVCLLLVQTSMLLPALHKRTDICVRGVPLLSAQIRRLYALTELVKISSLLVFSLQLIG